MRRIQIRILVCRTNDLSTEHTADHRGITTSLCFLCALWLSIHMKNAVVIKLSFLKKGERLTILTNG